LRGYGWTPYFVEGDEPERMHAAMATTLDRGLEQIKDIQHRARSKGDLKRPALADDRPQFPEGLDRPEVGRWSANRRQLPRASGAHCRGRGPPRAPASCWKTGSRATGRRSCSMGRADCDRSWPSWPPRASGAWAPIPTPTAVCCCATCVMPDFRDYAVKVPSPGRTAADTHVLGVFLRDVAKAESGARNFRVFGPTRPSPTAGGAVFEVTNRQWDARTSGQRRIPRAEGRVMEMLSEHQCEGWLEGYLLTGRHGCSTATRRSSTSSTRCSTSTPSG
jgi:xylulose-5-phosphate/fructose-6-phosphate phosphoketolase